MDKELEQRLVFLGLMPREGYSKETPCDEVLSIDDDVPPCIEDMCLLIKGLAYTYSVLEKANEKGEGPPGMGEFLGKLSSDLQSVTTNLSFYRGDSMWMCPELVVDIVGSAVQFCVDAEKGSKPYHTRVGNRTMPPAIKGEERMDWEKQHMAASPARSTSGENAGHEAIPGKPGYEVIPAILAKCRGPCDWK